MTLDDLFLALAAGQVSTEVELAALTHCTEVAKRQRVDPADVELVSGKVARRLVSRARKGVFEEVERPAAYLAQAIRFASIDEHRRRGRATEHAAGERASTRGSMVAEVEPPPTEHPILERVIEEAISYRQPRYQPALRDTWEEQCRLHGESLSLREIIASKLELPPVDPVVDRGCAAAHKRHQRLFDELRDTVETMKNSDLLGAFEYQAARHQIDRLKRRSSGEPAAGGASADEGQT